MNFFKSNFEILKKSSPAKMSRRFISCVIDMILVIALALGLFTISFNVLKKSDMYRSVEESIESEIKYYEEYSELTHIVEYVDGKRVNQDVMVIKNLFRAICLSNQIYGNKNQSQFVFDENHDVAKNGVASLHTDNVAYFYTQYIPLNDPDGKIVNMSGVNTVDYLFKKYEAGFGTDAKYMFLFDKNVSGVPVMYDHVAYYIFHYLFVDSKDDIGQTGATYYDAYYKGYCNMLEEAESLIIEGEPYYSTHYGNYMNKYSAQARYTNITLMISIFISSMLVLLIPRYLFKDGKSVGYKLLGLGTVRFDEESQPWYIILVKSIIESLGFISIGLLMYMFPPFNGVFDSMFVPMMSTLNISFGIILLVIWIICIVVNVFGLFSSYRQNLINILFKEKVVDIHYIDNTEENQKNEGRSF